jgi:hypothetical protein
LTESFNAVRDALRSRDADYLAHYEAARRRWYLLAVLCALGGFVLGRLWR